MRAAGVAVTRLTFLDQTVAAERDLALRNWSREEAGERLPSLFDGRRVTGGRRSRVSLRTGTVADVESQQLVSRQPHLRHVLQGKVTRTLGIMSQVSQGKGGGVTGGSVDKVRVPWPLDQDDEEGSVVREEVRVHPLGHLVWRRVSWRQSVDGADGLSLDGLHCHVTATLVQQQVAQASEDVRVCGRSEAAAVAVDEDKGYFDHSLRCRLRRLEERRRGDYDQEDRQADEGEWEWQECHLVGRGSCTRVTEGTRERRDVERR